MERVLESVKKGGIAIMPDYVEIGYDYVLQNGCWKRLDCLCITHYSPSKIKYDEKGEFVSDGWNCVQVFDDYESWDDFVKQYMKMIRTSKQNYWAYWYLLYDAEKLKEMTEYSCDVCGTNADGLRYKCKTCDNIDVCSKCFSDEITCPKCKQKTLFYAELHDILG